MQSNPPSPYYHQWLQFYKSRPLMVIWILRGRQIDKIDLALSQWQDYSRLHWIVLSRTISSFSYLWCLSGKKFKGKMIWLGLLWRNSGSWFWSFLQQKCLIREGFKYAIFCNFHTFLSKSFKINGNIHVIIGWC